MNNTVFAQYKDVSLSKKDLIPLSICISMTVNQLAKANKASKNSNKMKFSFHILWFLTDLQSLHMLSKPLFYLLQ